MKNVKNSNVPGQTFGRRSKGQGMVEFAMAVPVLLMLIFGIMEFGRLLFVYSSVTAAAREAARYGAAAGTNASGTIYYKDCDGIRGEAVGIGMFAGITNTEASVSIEYDRGPDLTRDTITESCPVGGTGPDLLRGDRVIVTVTAVFEPAQGLIPLPEIPITSVVRRTIVTDVPVW